MLVYTNLMSFECSYLLLNGLKRLNVRHRVSRTKNRRERSRRFFFFFADGSKDKSK